VGAVAAAVAAILGKLEAIRVVLLVFLRVVVAALALLAGEDNHHPVLFFGHSLVLARGPDIKKTDTRSVPPPTIS
jgi:hypothetical protein